MSKNVQDVEIVLGNLVQLVEATLFATIQPVSAAVRRLMTSQAVIFTLENLSQPQRFCSATFMSPFGCGMNSALRSNWGPCSDNYQERVCQSPEDCNDVQVKSCTSGGGGSSPTNTPTPTPTPGPWVKLKSTSFYSPGSLVNNIPLLPAAYDSEDDGSPYFIISASGRDSGLTAGQSIHIDGLNANAKVNVNDWLASGYTSAFRMTPASFAGYVKARKEYKSISSLASIDGNGIYLWSGGEPLTIDDAGKGRFDNYKVVLVSSGTVDVEAGRTTAVQLSTDWYNSNRRKDESTAKRPLTTKDTKYTKVNR